MRRHFSGFALVDLLAIGAAGAVFLAIGVPTLSRARELSKRMVCSVNLAGIGASGSIYANANKGSWMIPAFMKSAIGNPGVDYLAGTLVRPVGLEVPGEIGFERHRASYSETVTFPSAGSTAVSTTRAFWMLVRSGDVNVRQFICPSDLVDFPDPTENVDLYYDFTEYDNISYGYQVPFGPYDTRPREGMDLRQVAAADKGPFYLRQTLPLFVTGRSLPRGCPIHS